MTNPELFFTHFPALLHAAALAASGLGMAWLALSMEEHWSAVCPERAPLAAHRVRWLRGMGAMALAASLGLCLAADHPSMAVLVWCMGLTAAALVIALLLTWRAAWLQCLVSGMAKNK